MSKMSQLLLASELSDCSQYHILSMHFYLQFLVWNLCFVSGLQHALEVDKEDFVIDMTL